MKLLTSILSPSARGEADCGVCKWNDFSSASTRLSLPKGEGRVRALR
jgi:hypothetical protein